MPVILTQLELNVNYRLIKKCFFLEGVCISVTQALKCQQISQRFIKMERVKQAEATEDD